MNSIYAPVHVRESLILTHVGDTVPGAEDPCWNAAPGLARSFCKWYAAHPEKRPQPGEHPLARAHLHFPPEMAERARAQQAEYDANPTLYTAKHYGKFLAIPAGAGIVSGIMWGTPVGIGVGVGLMVAEHIVSQFGQQFWDSPGS